MKGKEKGQPSESKYTSDKCRPIKGSFTKEIESALIANMEVDLAKTRERKKKLAREK